MSGKWRVLIQYAFAPEAGQYRVNESRPAEFDTLEAALKLCGAPNVAQILDEPSCVMARLVVERVEPGAEVLATARGGSASAPFVLSAFPWTPPG